MKTLKELCDVLGGVRELTLCKELTKKHESFVKTTIDEASASFDDDESAPRGEYVLVIRGKSTEELEQEKAAEWENISVIDHVEKYIAEGMTKKDAIKQVALDRNLPKREVYAEVEVQK